LSSPAPFQLAQTVSTQEQLDIVVLPGGHGFDTKPHVDRVEFVFGEFVNDNIIRIEFTIPQVLYHTPAQQFSV
jgi:hypothetical protein